MSLTMILNPISPGLYENLLALGEGAYFPPT